MSLSIQNEPDFQTVVGYAKGLARQRKQRELSPLLLLCGFELARRSSALKSHFPGLESHNAAIERAAAAGGIKLLVTVKPFDGGSMPVSETLREIFKISGKSMDSLAEALLKSIEETNEDRQESQESISVLLRQEIYGQIAQFASTIAEGKGLKNITPELLTAGAYFAYRQGLLSSRPSVCAHIVAYEPPIKELIGLHDWTFQSLEKPKNLLPPSPSLEEAIAKSPDACDPLFAVLNAGIGTAVGILQKKRIAFHEAGHAVISHILRPKVDIAEISIIDADECNGHVSYDRTCPYLDVVSRETFLDGICVQLAGRVSEQKRYGHNEVDAGAHSDLEGATKRAWDAITKYGFDFEFGPINLEIVSRASAASGGWLFDQAQRRLQQVLKEGLSRTERLVEENWAGIEAVAEVLFEKKKLTADDLLGTLGRLT